MNAMSTFLESLLFAVACVLGWAVFPIFIIAGGLALFLYALIAEITLSLAHALSGATALSGAEATEDQAAARKAAHRLCGTP
jgi:hypothetical protein